MIKQFIALVSISMMTLFGLGCKSENATPQNPKTYVLVHGAWHGKWTWNKVVSELQKQGHTVVPVELPGHGDDKTPPQQVTMDAYVARVGEAMNAQPGKVVLVGHSMGGLVISAAAEKYTDKIESLVYLAAFLPKNGESLFAIEGRNPKPTVPPALIPSADQSYVDLKKDAIPNLFYNDCSPADVQFATTRLTSQPAAPLFIPVALTDARFGRVPRYYIECTNDNAINIALQRDMYAATPCLKVFSLNSGHSPFLSMPTQLTTIFDQITQPSNR
jgi:pimeloyl-ACP methyl ester carboxylesterase